MRLIGHLASESTARMFSDVLYVEGIDSNVEQDKESGWAVWVADEDKMGLAIRLLDQFRENPSDPKHKAAAKLAAESRAEKNQSDSEYRKRVHDRSDTFRTMLSYGLGPLSMVLIGISVIVYLFTLGESGEALKSVLRFGTFGHGIKDIASGQVWRLITPVFLHFGVLHLVFNMLWLRDLGSMIEAHQGSLRLALLVLVIGAVSNLAQYFWSGVSFGGMSGVVYGLLGYIWLRGKFDPASGLFLHQTTVTMMLVWLVLCYTGLLGHIANAAHTVGLGLGLALGYLTSLRRL